MLETKKAHRKATLSPQRPMVALLAMFACTESVLADGIVTYGQRLCAEAGIAVDDCTFLSAGPMPLAAAEPDGSSREPTKGAKAATLIEHAAWLCEKQGVPLEDCKALPTAYRTTEQEASPSPFLTILPTPPGPPAVYAEPAPSARQQMRTVQQPPPVGYGPEPVATAQRSVGYIQQPRPDGYVQQPIPTAQQGVAYDRLPPAVDYGVQPVPAAQPRAGYVQDPPLVYDPAPPIYGQALPVYDEVLAPRRRRPAIEVREEAFYAQEGRPARLDRQGIDRLTGPANRCRRAVRYSRLTSHRYVACNP